MKIKSILLFFLFLIGVFGIRNGDAGGFICSNLTLAPDSCLSGYSSGVHFDPEKGVLFGDDPLQAQLRYPLDVFGVLVESYVLTAGPKEGVFSISELIQDWAERKLIVVDVGSGYIPVEVEWLRTQGVSAFALDSQFPSSDPSSYLIRGNAQNLKVLLKARGISKVDVFISMNLFNYDYMGFHDPDFEETEKIIRGIRDMIAEDGIVLLYTDHGTFNDLTEREYHFETLAALFSQYGLKYTFLKSVHSRFAGLSLFQRHKKPSLLAEIEESGLVRRSL